MGKHDDAEQLQFARRAEWHAWLNRHHATSDGVWVVYGKKAATFPSPTYLELVLEALCFGWIDSRPGRVDDERTKLYFCPRKPGSVWAATNKGRVEQLVAEGLMTPAGQAVIDRAKADGSWGKLDTSDTLTVPRDLAQAFRAYPGSRKTWDAFPPGVRKQHIYWVEDAKRPETRAKRADEVARLAQQGIRANQWRPKNP
jgi:uncharacterized protein YdeI (YjbR/CyaY-like superfamily)